METSEAFCIPNLVNFVIEMSAAKIHMKEGPSTLALLVDNITKMSEAEQKLLWIQLNLKKIVAKAEELDRTVLPNSLNPVEIENLIAEAKKHGGKK